MTLSHISSTVRLNGCCPARCLNADLRHKRLIAFDHEGSEPNALNYILFSPSAPDHEAPPLTAFLSGLPGLKTGTVEAATDTFSPVRGLRAVRAGRSLVPKVPNPTIRTSSPSARASATTSKTPLIAAIAATLLLPVRLARRSANSDLFTHALPIRPNRDLSSMLRRSARYPRNARFPHSCAWTAGPGACVMALLRFGGADCDGG